MSERRAFRSGALWLGAVLGIGLLFFLYHYLEVLAEGRDLNPLRPFISELTGALTAGLFFFPVRALVRKLPLTRTGWPRRLPVYLAALIAAGMGATTLMWGLRAVLYPLAGLGAYDYGVMPVRYLMEFPLQVIWFTGEVAGIHIWNALAAARQRELRAAQLEGSLARAELRNLRLQLQPHFLFNALNTISATMYDDPRAADEMLAQLAELLRASLRTAQTDEVPLHEELAVLDCYLAILRARFGDRLTVSIETDPGTAEAFVPSMLLQLLVENAVRHGNLEGAERLGRGTVAIRARQEDGHLILEVEDDGDGAGSTAPGTGLGLSGTAERLHLLYGDDQSFTAGYGGGGFRVRATLPLRRAEARP